MEKPLWMWILFIGIILSLLVIDLDLLNRKPKPITVKKSLVMSAFYISMGLLFGGFIFYKMGRQSFEEYLTGFLVEKTLSLDNIFIISLIFSGLSIPRQYQHRVLFFGILGVIVLRGGMIALGVQLITHFRWVLYIFAVLMIFTGVKMFFTSTHKKEITQNPILKFTRKYLRTTNELHGNKFFVFQQSAKSSKPVIFFTPLFVALLVIEFTDLIFAIDSVPAIFAITQEPYIIYTSNIFAILGLRALYFALSAVIDKFLYLKYALALILIFIGSKIFIARFMGWEKFPSSVSLLITIALIAGGIVFSLYMSKKHPAKNHSL